MTAIGTEARVCADIERRQQLGLAKYGTSVESNPLALREWLQHAYEETLDKAIYLRRAIEEMDKQHGNAWPIRGVRVDDDKVIVTVRGGNDAARWLCGAILATLNEPKGHG